MFVSVRDGAGREADLMPNYRLAAFKLHLLSR